MCMWVDLFLDPLRIQKMKLIDSCNDISEDVK